MIKKKKIKWPLHLFFIFVLYPPPFHLSLFVTETEEGSPVNDTVRKEGFL